MKAVVAAFNQEKALVGAFSVITNLRICFGWNFLKHYYRLEFTLIAERNMPHQGFVHRSWADFQQFDHLLTTHLLNFGLDFPEEPSVENLDSYLQRVMTHSGIVSNNIFHDFLGINWSGRDLTFLQNLPGFMKVSAANRLTGEVVQSRRRPLLGPSPG